LFAISLNTNHSVFLKVLTQTEGVRDTELNVLI